MKKSKTARPPTPRMSLKDIRNLNLNDDESEDEDNEEVKRAIMEASPPPSKKLPKKKQITFEEPSSDELKSCGVLTLKLTG